MSLRIDASEWISGALLIGETGLGVLAENVPSTGTSGASYLYNDLSLPADNGKEICGRITAWPADGTLYAYEDGSFSFTGAPDGAYTFDYQLYVDGVATGSPATVDLTVGVLTLRPGLLTNSNTFFAPVVSLASGPQTLAPELFSNTSSFFSPTVAPGTVTLTPSLFTNDNTFFDCVVLRDGDQILSPSLFTNDNAFFSLVVNGGQTTYAGEIDLTPRKWYIKRNKKILLFNNAQEADAFIEAEEAADQAIHEAQKTSRRARKRLRDKIITVEPAQTVDVDQLAQAVEHFSIPVDLPYLLAQQDFERVMQILALAADMQDEEDVELLLLA